MKKLFFIISFLLSSAAFSGSLEDMEEAIIRNNSADAITLIKRGMDVNSVDKAGNSLLMQVVRRDMPEFFDYLIKRKARINTRNRNAETALSIAAYTGKLDYVQRLVEAGAELEFFGWPPLIYAAYNGHTSIVDYLLKRGADINATTANGSTALFFAARFGHQSSIELLLDNKADPTIHNERDETAVDWAMKAENTDIADLLRAAGGRSGKSIRIELSQ